MTKFPDNMKNPFSVPENYFEQFSQDMQTRVAEERLKERFGTENPFHVPKDYFGKLFLLKSEKKIVPQRNLFTILVHTAVSIAAGLLIFLTFRSYILETNSSNLPQLNQVIAFDTLKNPTSDTTFYEDIDENTIVSFISEPETAVDSASKADDEILDYVTDGTDDPELIAAF